MRAVWQNVIGANAGMKLLITAENGSKVMSLLHQGIDTDVIISDINLPEMDGLSLTKAVREEFPHIKVVICSLLDHPYYIQKALDAGASGFLNKDVAGEEIICAIREIHKGRKYISKELEDKI